jgi:hypothetical protein
MSRDGLPAEDLADALVVHEYQASRQDVARLLAVVHFACADTMAQLARCTHADTT